MEQISNGIWLKRGNTNVGLIECDGKRYLIDTGSSEKFAKSLSEEIGNVDFVLNTHSHADHIQGNHLFSSMGARICADDLERLFIEKPFMESFYLY
ncbi:MAG: MBL fold metallo-hydrolase, partial [Athalassotoga sp.]